MISSYKHEGQCNLHTCYMRGTIAARAIYSPSFRVAARGYKLWMMVTWRQWDCLGLPRWPLYKSGTLVSKIVNRIEPQFSQQLCYHYVTFARFLFYKLLVSSGFRITQCKKATVITRKAVHCQVDGGKQITAQCTWHMHMILHEQISVMNPWVHLARFISQF